MQGLSAIVNGVCVSRHQDSLHSRRLMTPQFYFVTDIAQIKQFDAGVIVWLAGSFACDLLITTAMTIMVGDTSGAASSDVGDTSKFDSCFVPSARL